MHLDRVVRVSLVAMMGWVSACGSKLSVGGIPITGDKESPAAPVQMKFTFAGSFPKDFSLTGVEKPFLVVAVVGAGMEKRIFRIKPGSEEALSIPSGANRSFYAALAYRRDEGAARPSFLYATTMVDGDVSEKNKNVMTLKFMTFEVADGLTVKGILNATGLSPAPGVTISPLEPYTGATYGGSDGMALATTDGAGFFSFVMPRWSSSGNFDLRLLASVQGRNYFQTLPISVGSSPEIALPYLALDRFSTNP